MWLYEERKIVSPKIRTWRGVMDLAQGEPGVSVER